MLSSIHPFGERARNQRYGTTTAAFLVGSVSGGLTLGTVAALFSVMFRGMGAAAHVSMLTLVAAAVWDLFGLPLPSLRRQVDENWLTRYRGWVYGLGFGFQLGVGFSTYIRSALTYGFVLAGILSGSPRLALSSGIAFGLARGVSIFVTARIHSPPQLRSMFSRIGKSQRPVQVGGALGVVMLGLLGLGGIS